MTYTFYPLCVALAVTWVAFYALFVNGSVSPGVTTAAFSMILIVLFSMFAVDCFLFVAVEPSLSVAWRAAPGIVYVGTADFVCAPLDNMIFPWTEQDSGNRFFVRTRAELAAAYASAPAGSFFAIAYSEEKTRFMFYRTLVGWHCQWSGPEPWAAVRELARRAAGLGATGTSRFVWRDFADCAP